MHSILEWRSSDDPRKVEQVEFEQYSLFCGRMLNSACFRWKRVRNSKERFGKTSSIGKGFWQQRKGRRDLSRANASANATRQSPQ